MSVFPTLDLCDKTRDLLTEARLLYLGIDGVAEAVTSEAEWFDAMQCGRLVTHARELVELAGRTIGALIRLPRTQPPGLCCCSCRLAPRGKQ
jgi:hypothetical protein